MAHSSNTKQTTQMCKWSAPIVQLLLAPHVEPICFLGKETTTLQVHFAVVGTSHWVPG